MDIEPGTWRVVGRVAGPKLPSTLKYIDNIAFGPLPKQVTPLERVGGLRLKHGSDTNYASSAGDIRVSSNTYFWVDILAESAADAISRAEAHYVPRLQAALSLRVDGLPYMVEVLWATNGEKNEGNWSGIISGAFWLPEEFPTQEFDSICRDYATILGDETARADARLLSSAIQQQAISSAAYLLSYFKVIELIANAVSPTDPPEREEHEEAILAELQRLLQSNRGVRKKISAVSDAETKLARLAGRYLSLRIEGAADKIGLTSDWTQNAVHFARLRNSYLSHPSTSESPRPEFNFSPRDLARTMLAAYVDHIAGMP